MYVFTVFVPAEGFGRMFEKIRRGGGCRRRKVDREPQPKPDALWPVRKGGIWLKLYNNSLVIAFAFLFLLSFFLHFEGSLTDYNDEQLIKHLPMVTAKS